MVFNVRV